MIYTVDLFELAHTGVNADTTLYSADETVWPTADGGVLTGAADTSDAAVNAFSYTVDLYEPIRPGVNADTTLYSADNTVWPTADGGILTGASDASDGVVIALGQVDIAEAADATDVLDAELISVSVPEGGGEYYRPPRPFPVEGVGYGILPELEGEARGVVVVIGDGASALPRLGGEATATVGVAGRSAARIVIRAAAIGNRGQIGTATGIFTLAASGIAHVGASGSGCGMIVNIEADAIGQHYDEEAAVMAFLLAA